MNFLLGFGLVGTMVSASTIVQQVVSDEMRGRVMGLFPLTMGLALANAGPVSVIGQLTSLQLLLPVLAWTMLFLALAVVVLRPTVRAIQPPGPLPGVPELAAE